MAEQRGSPMPPQLSHHRASPIPTQMQNVHRGSPMQQQALHRASPVPMMHRSSPVPPGSQIIHRGSPIPTGSQPVRPPMQMSQVHRASPIPQGSQHRASPGLTHAASSPSLTLQSTGQSNLVVNGQNGQNSCGSAASASVSGIGRVRVLRPVRPSAGVGGGGVRTNRQPLLSQSNFARSVLPLMTRLRQAMLDCTSGKLSRDDTMKKAREVEKIYNDLEQLARCVDPTRPENSSTVIPQLTKMFSESYINVDSNIHDNLTDSIRSNDALVYNATVLDSLLRMDLRKGPPSIYRSKMAGSEMKPSNVKMIHEQFTSALAHLLSKERDLRQSRMRVIVAQTRPLVSVVEVEVGKNRDTVYHPHMKVVLFVQYGHLIELKFGSMDEILWNKDTEKHIESRYEVFRLMSSHALDRLMSSSTTKLSNVQTLNTLLHFLQTYSLAFLTPCVCCKKLVKDLLPPVRLLDFQPGRAPSFQHEGCRHLPPLSK